MIRYQLPRQWIRYDPATLFEELVDAKTAVLTLRQLPYQREWVEALQQVQLKLEVAGTSRIEGAEFTEGELEAAMREGPQQMLSRSQRQVQAAVRAYQWISTLPDDRPLTVELISELHRLIVTGADDDHCPPGRLRQPDHNVIFGNPPHRGAEGGAECAQAVAALSEATRREFRDHDPLIQALALHYHVAAIHPFEDGNGRTARALEALLLQRAGLRSSCFIPMSNYYYDEKPTYLTTLARVRAQDHDLTAFLKFGLRGIAVQSQRLLREIQDRVAKALYRDMMLDLFSRLKSPRKRVIAQRQIEILKLLLEGPMEVNRLKDATLGLYSGVRHAERAAYRDLTILFALGAIEFDGNYRVRVRLEWPTEITETEFFARVKAFPKARTHGFLR